MAARITAAQMLECYDARLIGDLVADDDSRVDAGDLLSDTVLAAVLVRATGQYEAAVRVGNRYTEDQLDALDTNALGHQTQIIADIAMSLLLSRRVGAEWAQERAAFEQVKETHLERLRNGENIYGTEDHADAGLPKLAVPSLVEITQRRGMRDAAPQLFPARRIPY